METGGGEAGCRRLACDVADVPGADHISADALIAEAYRRHSSNMPLGGLGLALSSDVVLGRPTPTSLLQISYIRRSPRGGTFLRSRVRSEVFWKDFGNGNGINFTLD